MKECQSDLANMPKPALVRDKVNLAERCKCLDALLNLAWYVNAKNANFSIDPIWRGFGNIYGEVLQQGIRDVDCNITFKEILQRRLV